MNDASHAAADPAPAGVDVAAVTAWLGDRAPGVEPPVRAQLITGGHSNLTFSLTDQGGRRWVLRRPPLHQVLATAHDMAREHRIISALAATDVPVAPVVGLSPDDTVNGAPFYVMDFVDGIVVRDAEVGRQFSPAQLRTAGEGLIDTLARIHAVDPDEVGLGDLGRREGYLARQLQRWHGQFEKSKTRDIPEIDAVHQRLVATMPAQVGATIVHGDYRLDNCLVDPDGHLLAVLDWELCTLGDPLADVGLLVVYSPDAGDPVAMGTPAATTLEGFPSRVELLDRYARLSGRDLTGIEYYVAFGYWKLACIVEGVYARYLGGAMGEHEQSTFAFLGDHVLHTVRRATEVLDQGI